MLKLYKLKARTGGGSMSKKGIGYYGIVSPNFRGVVQTIEEFNAKTNGKKGAKGKRFPSYEAAQQWVDNQMAQDTKKEGYYAVYHPDAQEIVFTSKEYLEKIQGKKQTKGKKFKTEKEAKAWLNQLKKAENEPKQATSNIGDKKEVVIYVDGSFKEPYGKYGFIAYKPMQDAIQHKDFGYVYDKRFNELKNIGAELMACIRALEWSYCNDIQVVHIIYDYNGIVDILKNKPKNGAYLIYYNMMNAFLNKMDIHFLHVRHGNKDLHKKAHQLAQLELI